MWTGSDNPGAMMPDRLPASVEAILFSSPGPVSVDTMARVLSGVAGRWIRAAIEELDRRYQRQRRPYRIVERQGYVIELRPEYLPLARKLVPPAAPDRLSAAAVEVLALVAYRQPIARAAIEALRGRDARGPLQTLVRRGLIRAVEGPEAGTIRYQTTDRFLEAFGLDQVQRLPRADEVDPGG